MHQRERGHLPALSQTPTNDAPAFSKSAPNLDKSRTNNNLAQQTNDSPTKASTSHNNMLGKSVDGLNIIRSNKNKNKTNATTANANMNVNGNANATTKLDSDIHFEEDFRIENGLYDPDDYDDNDDDNEGITGCFSFISRNDNNESYSKRKKHSLDSKMEAHVPSPQNVLTVQKFGSNAYGQEVQVTDERIIDEPTESSRNLDDVPYDRVFFRNIQKSLDDIFSNDIFAKRDDLNEQFSSRNSKSSGDLTMYSHTDNDSAYEQYRFARFGSSKSQFRRECFFVDQNNDDNDDYNQNGNESSFDTGTNHEYSQKSTESSLTDSREPNELSNGETHFREDHSQLINDNNNDNTASASRKSSVTFRNSNDNLAMPPLSPPCTSTSNEIFYENINQINMNSGMLQHSFVSTSTTDSIFFKEKPTKQAGQRFEIISHPHTYTNATNLIDAKSKLSKKDNKTNKKSKHRNMFNPKQFLINMLNPKSFSKKNSVLSSNSFYTKFDAKTEMNQQLLDEDDANTTQCNSNATNGNDDSIYLTKNFLLAKQHDN